MSNQNLKHHERRKDDREEGKETYDALPLLAVCIRAEPGEGEHDEHAPDAALPTRVVEDLADAAGRVEVALDDRDVRLGCERARRGRGRGAC